MKKIMSSGVIGLDKILEGGFICPSIILIAGGIGTGKTTLALQSLFLTPLGIKSGVCSLLPFRNP